jgi:putative ubiquitin-RnfH superfamily antitoxin RatB of RatAB toxin-antitoxin module
MTITVSIVYSPAPRQVFEEQLVLDDGATAWQAVMASGLLAAFPELDLGHLPVGVWGRKAAAGQVLRDRDRIEIYRPLQVDPKVARRERFRRQGARSTGLFARQRAGGKAGY